MAVGGASAPGEISAHVPTPDGMLYSVRVGPPGCKRVLVALHGGPGVSHEPLRALDALAGVDRCVVYFDQRGVGRSSRPEGRWTQADLISDLDVIREHWGVRRVDLVGHSWGAYLAALYAGAHGDRVRRLVYSSPAPLSESGWARFEDSMRARIRSLRADGVIPPSHTPPSGSDDCGPTTAPLTPAYLFDPRATVEEPPSSCSLDGYTRTWDALPRSALLTTAQAVRHRATLLQGEGEVEGEVIVTEWDQHHGGKLQIQTLPRCGHLLHTECPDRWVEGVRDALD